MKNTTGFIAVAAVALLACAIFAQAWTLRWQVAKIEGKTVRIDRWTGKTETLLVKKEIVPEKQPLPVSDEVRRLMQITGIFKRNFEFAGGPGFSAKIYNGNDVAIDVGGFRAAANGVWKQINIPHVTILPKSEEWVEIPLNGVEDYNENTVSLVDAYTK